MIAAQTALGRIGVPDDIGGVIVFLCSDITSAAMKTAERILIDFNNTDEKENWQIINDDVMGGVSQSEIIFNDTGTATFQGKISLENNGGFASIRSKSHSYRLGGYVGLHVRITR